MIRDILSLSRTITGRTADLFAPNIDVRKKELSERIACLVLGQARSTQRHVTVVEEEAERLRVRIIELATKYGRYGYRRVTALLMHESWQVNHKRVERIWRQEGAEDTQEATQTGASVAQ